MPTSLAIQIPDIDARCDSRSELDDQGVASLLERAPVASTSLTSSGTWRQPLCFTDTGFKPFRVY